MKRFSLFILVQIIQVSIIIGQDSYIVRKHTGISTRGNEIAAIPFGEKIYYCSEAVSIGASSPRDSKGRILFTIYEYSSKLRSKKQIQGIVVSKSHDGPVSFTGDGVTMVYSQQRPTVAGNLSMMGLFFAENIEDSFGGFDLYMSRFQNGRWSPPENLGPAINTEKNELYPFIHISGKLYFSSSGHDNSKDGIDLFESSVLNGQWLKARKLKSPINSKGNDNHVYFNEDFTSGYLTSDRDGGSKDIFIVENKDP